MLTTLPPPRHVLETIIFGSADFMASINMKSLVVGEQPPGYRRTRTHTS